MRTYPARGPKDGRGARIDDASGFLRPAQDAIHDVRQGITSVDFADITPGFGTYHPQDLKQLWGLNDPSPIPDARPDPNNPLSAADLGYTDAQVEESIRLGVPLRSIPR